MDVNAADLDGHTALMELCSEGETAYVKLLLNNGADATLEDADGSTALSVAAMGGSIPCMEAIWDSAGEELLHPCIPRALKAAAMGGKVDSLEFILSLPWTDIVDSVPDGDGGVNSLMAACMEGEAEAARYLLSKGANALLQDDDGVTALCWAAIFGNMACLEALWESAGEDLIRDMGPALLKAALHGQVASLRFLLSLPGADIDTMVDGKTPLMVACGGDEVEAARYLLLKGAVANLENDNGDSALSVAASNGCTECIGALVSAARLKLLPNVSKALIEAAREDQVGSLRLLRAFPGGADIDGAAAGEDGLTAALMAACMEGKEKATAYLLAGGGADATLEDAMGDTALTQAAIGGHVPCMKALWKSAGETILSNIAAVLIKTAVHGQIKSLRFLLTLPGVDVDSASGKEGFTPLMAACKEGKAETAQFLLAQGATVNLKDKVHLRTPFNWAAYEGHVTCLKVLWKAKGEQILPHVSRALEAAAKSGQSDSLHFLLSLPGTDIDFATEERGLTLLMEACLEGQSATAKYLISKGADVAKRDAFGFTALHHACGRGRVGCAWLLLQDERCDVNSRNGQGFTPFLAAARCIYDVAEEMKKFNKQCK